MLKFATIGTNWITDSFIEAAHATGKMKLHAVYSRQLSTAEAFAVKYQVAYCIDSLEQLLADPVIEAVYIASPNVLHHQQILLCLAQGKHVICEKPLAANDREVASAIDCAQRYERVLFEAYKTAYLPNFAQIRHYLPKLGKLRKAIFNYCQYSSRYPRYLAGDNPNTFNPAFANGSMIDIGYYCLAAAVALWGAPQQLQASASLLESGVDAQGTAILNYGDFDVTLLHSKVSDSHIASEIQGEEGVLIIDSISRCTKITFIPRQGQPQDISVDQVDNPMYYEALAFLELVETERVQHDGLADSLLTAQLLTEIRQLTGVVFPTDQ